MRRFVHYLYRKLVQPFLESTAPIHAVCAGASIGLFVGLTPTMGVQMYIITLLWVFAHYVLRARFNLPIALSMCWVTNPVTLVPLYFGFLKTGNWAMEYWGVLPKVSSYGDFTTMIEQIRVAHEYLELRERIVNSVVVLFWEFGWPMVVGSIFWAVPGAAVAYPVTFFGLRYYRRRQAELEGISYQAWQERHVTWNGWW